MICYVCVLYIVQANSAKLRYNMENMEIWNMEGCNMDMESATRYGRTMKTGKIDRFDHFKCTKTANFNKQKKCRLGNCSKSIREKKVSQKVKK
jgi:hypothetical protein